MEYWYYNTFVENCKEIYKYPHALCEFCMFLTAMSEIYPDIPKNSAKYKAEKGVMI